MNLAKSLQTMMIAGMLLTSIACGRSTTTEQVADSVNISKTDSAAINHPDSLVANAEPLPVAKVFDISGDTEWDDSLKRYFTPEQIIKIKQAKAEYTQSKSAADLAHFFLTTLDTVATIMNKQIAVITPTETSGDNSPSIHWDWFTQYFPCLSSDATCSECSYDAITNLIPLIEKAATTPEKEDDLFFDLAKSVYGLNYNATGNIQNSQGWYTLIGCDFCNASLLGSGKWIDILAKLGAAAPARPLFGAKMDLYREAVLAVEDERYVYEKTKVMAELDEMISSPVLTAQDVRALKESRKKINGAYFDCENSDCKWPQY